VTHASFAPQTFNCAEVNVLSHQLQFTPATRLGIQDLVSGGHHRLILAGELDMATAPELQAVILRLCDEVDSLVVDLSRLTFMDSGGLRLVRLAQGLCRERACEFSIIPGPQQVTHLFEIMGLVVRPLAREGMPGAVSLSSNEIERPVPLSAFDPRALNV
jgi:anti-anti-sigma factor